MWFTQHWIDFLTSNRFFILSVEQLGVFNLSPLSQPRSHLKTNLSTKFHNRSDEHLPKPPISGPSCQSIRTVLTLEQPLNPYKPHGNLKYNDNLFVWLCSKISSHNTQNSPNNQMVPSFLAIFANTSGKISQDLPLKLPECWSVYL